MRGWSAVRSHSIRSSQTGSKLGILRALGLSFFFEGGSRSLEPGMAVVLPSSGFGFSRAAVRAVLALIAALVAVAAMAGPLSGCAWATTGHTFAGQFGGLGDGDGQFGEPLGNGPGGVAVMASTGEVFTADAAQASQATQPRVQRFSADGAFLSRFAIDPSFEGGVSGLAVDPRGLGAVYVATGINGGVPSVVKYSTTGVKELVLDGGPGVSINGNPRVAVDPVDGSVYVTATSTQGLVVAKFDPVTGLLSSSFSGSDTLEGGFSCPASGLAVDGLHQVYVLDPCKNRVDRFSPAGAYEISLDPQAAPQADGSPAMLAAVAADPVSNEVYVAHSGPVGLRVTHLGVGGVGVVYAFDAREATGGVRSGVMAVSGAGQVYLSDAARPFVVRYGPFEGPTVVTGSVSSVAARSAVLEGTIDPGGVASTYHFEYSTDLSFGSRTAESAEVSGSGAIAVSAAVPGLRPNTTYNYRIVGLNASGSIAGVPATVPLTTLSAPPEVVGPPFASAIGPRSARLHGTVNPNSNSPAVRQYVEFGTTTAYGRTVDALSDGVSPFSFGGDDVSVIASVSGLEPGTTYHFRVVAGAALFQPPFVDPQFGVDQTFVTAPAAAGGATGVTSKRATLTGTVNPHGLPTTYSFRYGATTAYGASTPEMNVTGNEPSHTNGVPGEIIVEAPIIGLNPGTVYNVQVVATSTYEEENPVTHEMETKTVTRYGANGNFVTPPSPEAKVLGPGAVKAPNAILVGDLNNHGADASYHFELASRDGSYTLSTPPATAPASMNDQRVRTAVTGLPPGTTFRVVLVVESNDAIGVSSALWFETETLPRSFPDGNVAYPPAPVEPGARPSIKFVSGVFTAKVRKKASRTGLLPVKLSATSAGIVTLTAKAKFGKKTVRVGRISQRVKAAAKTQVNVLLNSQARKRLRSGKKLRVTISVRQLGARTRSTSILLPGVTS